MAYNLPSFEMVIIIIMQRILFVFVDVFVFVVVNSTFSL